MRQVFYVFFTIITLVIGASGCKHKPVPQDVFEPSKEYTEVELRAYLDSLHQLDLGIGDHVIPSLKRIEANIEHLNRKLDEKDMAMLRIAMNTNMLNVKFRKNLPEPYYHNEFPKEEISTYVTILSFDEHPEEMNQFAFAFDSPEAADESDWFFFSSKKLIAKLNIANELSFKMSHFKDYDGNAVVYHNTNLQLGTGMGQSFYHFYKYEKDKLIPVLGEIEYSYVGLMPDYDSKGIDTEIVKGWPLKIKFKYERLHGYRGINVSSPIPQMLIQDSTLVTYHWSDSCKCLLGDYQQSTLNEKQLRAFQMNTDENFFIHTHHQMLKNHLDGPDSFKRIAVLLILEDNLVWNKQNRSNHD